jgi:hypothetical protein
MALTTDAFAGEAITVANTAIGPTSATFAPSGEAPAQRAVVTVETASLRYRYDGTAPTASVGHLALPGEVIVVDGVDNVAKLRMIRTGSTSAVVHVTYER